ncbi:unnamed protein product [Soboliphyme baturini]|uniref:HAP1 N-terminal domain-containing protein n=1 Tax=Soboliphyme baturini TaxID=241478 RepID=A0A183J9P5_9BILA|nr:unnamed protein product [Soboliphyme baturini]
MRRLFQAENLSLKEEKLRLECESDDLARDLVMSKIELRRNLDAAEDNIECLQNQVENLGRLCKDLQDDNRRLLDESERICSDISTRLEDQRKSAEEEKNAFMVCSFVVLS